MVVLIESLKRGRETKRALTGLPNNVVELALSMLMTGISTAVCKIDTSGQLFGFLDQCQNKTILYLLDRFLQP